MLDRVQIPSWTYDARIALRYQSIKHMLTNTLISCCTIRGPVPITQTILGSLAVVLHVRDGLQRRDFRLSYYCPPSLEHAGQKRLGAASDRTHKVGREVHDVRVEKPPIDPSVGRC